MPPELISGGLGGGSGDVAPPLCLLGTRESYQEAERALQGQTPWARKMAVLNTLLLSERKLIESPLAFLILVICNFCVFFLSPGKGFSIFFFAFSKNQLWHC